MPRPYGPERERLLAQYEIAVREFRISVRELGGRRGPEFQNEAQQVQRLHDEVMRACDRMERHDREHGCG
jgi:hypothetical protein